MNYLNLLFELNERQFWKGGKHNHSNSLFKLIKLEISKFLKRKEPQRFDLKIDYIGLILVVAVHWFTIIPIVYLPAPIISPNEAMSLALNLFLDGLDQYPIWVSFPLRLSTGLGSINCAREACRAIAVIFVVLAVVADSRCNGKFSEKSKTDFRQRGHNWSNARISTTLLRSREKHKTYVIFCCGRRCNDCYHVIDRNIH